jgi:hypothetical protein
VYPYFQRLKLYYFFDDFQKMDPESRLDVLRGVVKETTADNKEDLKDEKKEDMFEKKVQFQCELCGLCEMCQYKGKTPPFVKNLLEFTESCYVMVDPFSPRQSRFGNNFLVLGGECEACSFPLHGFGLFRLAGTK